MFKTNNYLRAIDRRLGNPNNTFNVINEFSWDVYVHEVRKDMGRLEYSFLVFKYYMVRAALYAMYLHLRLRMALGLHFDEEALQDFDLDVVHNSDEISLHQDSLMGIAR